MSRSHIVWERVPGCCSTLNTRQYPLHNYWLRGRKRYRRPHGMTRTEAVRQWRIYEQECRRRHLRVPSSRGYAAKRLEEARVHQLVREGRF